MLCFMTVCIYIDIYTHYNFVLFMDLNGTHTHTHTHTQHDDNNLWI